MSPLVTRVSLNLKTKHHVSPPLVCTPLSKVSGIFLEAGFEAQQSTPGVARRRQWKAQMETATVENNTKKWKFRRSFPFSSLLFPPLPSVSFPPCLWFGKSQLNKAHYGENGDLSLKSEPSCGWRRKKEAQQTGRKNTLVSTHFCLARN